MQRKALKQLGKVTQWTNEKVFSSEKTQLSEGFTEFEKEADVRRVGIERLHATSLPFFHQLTKVKPTADPYPPSGSGKDKILHTEALGLVMIDYGEDVGGAYGDGLARYGRARCKLAAVQEEFGSRLSENYIAGMENALGAVNDYKTFRKKLDSRRLALDSAISRAQGSKKDTKALEAEVETAKERYEEVEEETQVRMMVIQEQESRQWEELGDLFEAELDYFSRCKEILEELRMSWPTRDVSSSARPRAKSNASTKSFNKVGTRSYPKSSAPASEEEDCAPNRARSQSNASSTKARRSIMPSFGTLGKKGAALASMGAPKRKGFSKDKDRYEDEARQALHSEDDEDESPPPARGYHAGGRARSGTALSASRISLASDSVSASPPTMRRTHTTPAHVDAQWVKALYDFTGSAADELTFHAGDIIEVKKEVSADWWIGETEGHSGLFPATYCEEYVPTPQTAVPPPRTIPPPPGGRSRSGTGRSMPSPSPVQAPLMPVDPSHGFASGSEMESYGYPDGEHHATASLSLTTQPPSSYKSPAPPPARKAAPPPPPPSRRTQSSGNLTSAGVAVSSYLSPPQPAFARGKPASDSSPEGSPFAGSEEDEDEEIFGGRHDTAVAPAEPFNLGAAVGGLNHGLGGVHINQAPGGREDVRECAACGCQDFTQNVFKPKGTCSTCFHQH